LPICVATPVQYLSVYLHCFLLAVLVYVLLKRR
jgi:hypothetical protein